MKKKVKLLTLPGCVNDPAFGARGSHSLSVESQLPVVIAFTSGHNATPCVGASCDLTIVSVDNPLTSSTHSNQGSI